MGGQLAPSLDDNARRDERAVTLRATQKWGVVPPKFASRLCYWPERIVSAVEG